MCSCTCTCGRGSGGGGSSSSPPVIGSVLTAPEVWLRVATSVARANDCKSWDVAINWADAVTAAWNKRYAS